MSNYTTQTASLKATTIDTRKIDTKQIDTKTLNINGISIDQKLKQAAIASRGNLMGISFQDGVAITCGIFVKDGQMLDEPITCNCNIVNDNLAGYGLEKYLVIKIITNEGIYSVFNEGTIVNKVFSILPQYFSEIKLKEVSIYDSQLSGWMLLFELGAIADNLEEIYGGAFYNGTIYILYQDTALMTVVEQTSASTYSLRGENTSILDKLRQTVQQNS